MAQQSGHVQTRRLINRAAVVLHRDHRGPGLRKQLGRSAAHIAKALHGDTGLGDVQTDVLRGFLTHGEDATPGGFASPQRAAQGQGLAGHHARGGGAFVHGVGVHHPGHDLLVGVHVRGRNVLGRADDDADLAGVAPCQALQLAARQGFGVDPDAALGAAKRQVDGRVFHRHPGRQGHDFGQGDVLVKAHAAFARASAGVVLHAVAFKVGHGAVVQFDGHVHDQGAFGAFERFDPARQRAEIGRDAVDLLQVNPPGAQVLWVQIRGQCMGACGGEACR